jgi:predicted regulator of Ras-like GTPase activity (Roadblock/LC7/MglB family)
MNTVERIVHDMVDQVPGVIGVVLIDGDGIPMAWAGELGTSPDDLGATLAASYTCYASLGEDLGQFHTDSLMVEYDDLKLVQQRMPRGTMAIVAEKSAPLGVIRMEAKRNIAMLTEAMESTAEARKRLMQAMKFRKSQAAASSAGKPASLISLMERKG